MQSLVCNSSHCAGIGFHQSCSLIISSLYPKPKLHNMPCTAMSQPSTSHGSAPCNSSAGGTSGKDGEGEVEYNVPGVSQDRNEKLGYGELRHGFWFFINFSIWKLNESSLVLTPLTHFRPMICDNPCPTHCLGDNLGNVADEYSKTPAVVGDHAPLQWWPALNVCRCPKDHHPHPHRAEDDLPAGHHSVPQPLLHPLSSLTHLNFSYSFTPKGLGSHQHRTPDASTVHGRLRSTALSLLPQADEQELYPPLAGNAWKHASLLEKLSCQINAKYAWVRSWCVSVVQLYPTHTAGTSGNWYSHEEEHGILQPDFV